MLGREELDSHGFSCIFVEQNAVIVQIDDHCNHVLHIRHSSEAIAIVKLKFTSCIELLKFELEHIEKHF